MATEPGLFVFSHKMLMKMMNTKNNNKTTSIPKDIRYCAKCKLKQISKIHILFMMDKCKNIKKIYTTLNKR